MSALSWSPVLCNLNEANYETAKLHWRMHYITFGRLPDEAEAQRMGPVCWDWRNGGKQECEARFARAEAKCTFSERMLFHSLEHAYHHLNWAWNVRRSHEECVWNFKNKDYARWSKFPASKVFSDLWPSELTMREEADSLGRGRICSTPTRIALQTAAIKLAGLCDLVEKQSLSEAEFGKRLRRIYAEFNMAWNARKDRTFVVTAKAFFRRRQFPQIFIKR